MRDPKKGGGAPTRTCERELQNLEGWCLAFPADLHRCAGTQPRCPTSCGNRCRQNRYRSGSAPSPIKQRQSDIGGLATPVTSLLTCLELQRLSQADFLHHNTTSHAKGSLWEKLDKSPSVMKALEVVRKHSSPQIQTLTIILLRKPRQHF